ncbi:YggS family pyridoxal phosphate-dependent enzyme [bacterium]|nr:YggS family pyridoxal phosphate-dependent enzyme [bacterium]
MIRVNMTYRNDSMNNELQDRIRCNLEVIKENIKGYNPKIVAVTKYYSAEHLVEAWRVGLRDFGESRVIESVEKINSLDDEIRLSSNYHFIGHLQRNKAKKAAGVFSLIQSVESEELLNELSTIARSKGIIQKILIQVNNSFEETKTGIAPSQLDKFLDIAQNTANIEVQGLMTMAPLGADELTLGRLFSEMRKLKEKHSLQELSMGMSDDYKIAVQEGATIIRIGRALFT